MDRNLDPQSDQEVTDEEVIRHRRVVLCEYYGPRETRFSEAFSAAIPIDSRTCVGCSRLWW